MGEHHPCWIGVHIPESLRGLLRDLDRIRGDYYEALKESTHEKEEHDQLVVTAHQVKLAKQTWTIVKHLVENQICIRGVTYVIASLVGNFELPYKFNYDQSFFDYYELLKEFHDYLRYSISDIQRRGWIFHYLCWIFHTLEESLHGRYPVDRLRFIESFRTKIFEIESKNDKYPLRGDGVLAEYERINSSETLTYKRMVVNLLYHVQYRAAIGCTFKYPSDYPTDFLTSQLFDGIMGINSRRSLLLSLCKLQLVPCGVPSCILLPTIVEQLDLLQTAYELRAKQTKYSREQCALLPTCLDLAFETPHDDPLSSVYICEFSYFKDILKYLERKGLLPDEDLAELDEHTKKRLHYYQHEYDNFHMCCCTKPGTEPLEFLCIGHLCYADKTTTTCPLLNRRCLFDREGRHWTDTKCTTVYRNEV